MQIQMLIRLEVPDEMDYFEFCESLIEIVEDVTGSEAEWDAAIAPQGWRGGSHPNGPQKLGTLSGQQSGTTENPGA